MFFFFSSRRRHTRCSRDWSSDVCSSDLLYVRRGHPAAGGAVAFLFAVGLLAAPALEAQGTQAGTQFSNWATLTFTSAGTGYAVASDTVAILVGQVAGVSLQPPRVNSGAPGTAVGFA